MTFSAAPKPSVQPPTREQIAVIDRLRHRLRNAPDWANDVCVQRADLDAVLALFPQLNPVDPDDEFVAPYKVCEECYEECGARHEHRSGHHDAEPVRVADMAPGTTFTARQFGGHWLRLVRVVGGVATTDEPHVLVAGIDPSTIRDVTPPKGDDRG